MMKPTRRNKGRAASRPKQRGANQAIPHPPAILPQIVHRQRMRFSCTTAQVNSAILWSDLLATINIAATAITAFALFDQVRLNFVELWAAPVQGNAPSQVAIEYSGGAAGQAGDGKIYSDSSMGIEPAHLRVAPAKSSQVSLWQSFSNATAFQLTCPVTAVIDVDCSFRTVQSAAPTALAAPAAATAGQLYFRGLDGLAIATTQLPPVTPGPVD